MGYVVDELFAFITTGDTGDEGVIAVELVGSDTAWPLVAADLTRVQQMIPFAEAIKEQTGHTYKLKHFTLLGDVSGEYLAQFKKPPDPAGVSISDNSRAEGDDKQKSNGGGKGNGSEQDVS